VDIIKYVKFFVNQFRGIDFVGGGGKFAYSYWNSRLPLKLPFRLMQTVMEDE